MYYNDVVLDHGPQPPVRPVKPPILLYNVVERPPGSEGPPGYEPEAARYAERYAAFLRQMDSFPAERRAWEKKHGIGPVGIAVGHAGEAVERDPRRYSIKPPVVPKWA